jgi:ABC-2 type transport system permease protein
MRLIRLALLYFRVGALNELQYRVNFLIQLLQSLVALGVGLVGLTLVFSHTTDLNGWTRPELLAVMGVHILMGGLINAVIQPNMQRLLEEVREGTLDYALTKPEDAQALVSVREFRIWQVVDVVMGVIVLLTAMFQLQARLAAWQALAFGAALLFGWAMVYAFWLMLTSTVFWFIRIDELVNLFEGVYAAGRWPVSVYPDWLRTGLTFLVPVAFAVTVPAEALTGRLTGQTLLGAAGLALALLLLARVVWRAGLRRYSGASA